MKENKAEEKSCTCIDEVRGRGGGEEDCAREPSTVGQRGDISNSASGMAQQIFSTAAILYVVVCS